MGGWMIWRKACHPLLASELRSITHQLENATTRMQRGGADGVKDVVRQPSPYLLAKQREDVLEQIRGMDGFHDFLLPSSFETLKHAAKAGPIVFLNASQYGCHALILKQDGALLPLSLLTSTEHLATLKMAIHRLAQGHVLDGKIQQSLDDVPRTRKLLQRKNQRRRTVQDDFRQLLGVLWFVIAQPVIRALDVQKTDTPRRLWWCPTGPFAFLPIHAAGVYTSHNEECDCVFDYVVSSYCSSPQDLVAPPPIRPNPDFKMLVAIEPESKLPATRIELEKIQSRIPDIRHLVTRIDSTSAPTSPKTILEDIKTSSIVHFGCHGSQDPSNPLDSCLLLSGGRLTISSLIRECQTSEAALAYLSACETAMGDEERPDESLTLAATMQFAGFRGVATMWEIEDEDGPIVADAFYGYLFREGSAVAPDITDAASALHLATKVLRDLDRPFHRWVPFVHYGI
ncbi:hypothetical protein CC2G_003701 [Coprinopsis cinerea AmutBmut pab1-1]|nr:hypothetical protein CC2G_003701 [Coprinopsis cinerea AmutBmut pab1-1]